MRRMVVTFGGSSICDPRSLAAWQGTLLLSGVARASRVKEIAYSEVPYRAGAGHVTWRVTQGRER